jgi:hypothetical protein
MREWCVEQAVRLGIPGPAPFYTGKIDQISYTLYPKIPGLVATQFQGNRDFIWRKLGEYARKYHQIEAHGFGSGFDADPSNAATI